jgi:Domain of unknown function (DUF4383)
MAHIPVNHHLRPLYRSLAVLAGAYVLAFGVVGLARTGGLALFARDGLPEVLGIRANRAFAVLSVVAGVVIVLGAVVGRNLDHWINLVGGVIFLVAGMAMMTLLQTDANLLGFTMTTCIVSFVIGLALFTAGLYGKTGSGREADVEERFRHGAGADPTDRARAADAASRPAADAAPRSEPAGRRGPA